MSSPHPRRTIGTRSQSRDEMEAQSRAPTAAPASAAVKENVENEQGGSSSSGDDFRPPHSPLSRRRRPTPPMQAGASRSTTGSAIKRQHQSSPPSTATTSRSASSLFSPPPSSGAGGRRLYASPAAAAAAQQHMYSAGGSGSAESQQRHRYSMKQKPDRFPDNWEQDMGGEAMSRRRGREHDYSGGAGGTPYSMSQQQAPQEAKTSESSTSSSGRASRAPPPPPSSGTAADDPHRAVTARMSNTTTNSNSNHGVTWDEQRRGSTNSSNAFADLDMMDFPAVADCLNRGSFAEESPPRASPPSRRARSSPRGSPPSHHQLMLNHYDQHQYGYYPYRSSPPLSHQPYPPNDGTGAEPPPQGYYQQGGPTPMGSPPYTSPYPLPQHGGAPYPPPPYRSSVGGDGTTRYPPSAERQQHYQPPLPSPWRSPPAQQNFAEYPSHSLERSTPHRPPPPKKRSNWDGNDSSSSTNSPEGSTTPEKVFPEHGKPSAAPSPFRSPLADKASSSTSKRLKRSPLFPGVGTPAIAQFGSWDTPGGTLQALHGATLGDDFSPMGQPSFAPFGDESPLQEGDAAAAAAGVAPMPFDAKLELARSDSGEDSSAAAAAAAAASLAPPPNIRQRQPAPGSSPFSTFVGELSPFPPHTRGSPPVVQDSREYPGGPNHPGDPAFLNRRPDEFLRQPVVPTPAKRSRPPPPPPPPPNRPAHPMASPVMSSHGSSQRQQPWYEHVAPSPGPFRLELGETPGKTRKGFEDINSLLRGATGPPPPHPRLSPPSGHDFDSGMPRPASRAGDLNTPIKTDSGSAGSGGPPPSGGGLPRPGGTFPDSARKVQTPRGAAMTTPRFTPMTKGTAATPGSRTPGSGGRGGPSSVKKKKRRNPCNCKKSKCLKLYCECFANELYCDSCNCSDCHNNTLYEPERQKAMKDTRAKNPNAFKARISVRAPSGATVTATPAAGHNMGCKCKKSECLKKYCECFQAGVMCGSKCKCVDCLNYVGSQALIDKRRKMKDHRGAEFAMRIADEAWKGGKHAGPPRGMNPRGMHPSPSGPPRGHPMSMSHMMHPSPSPHHRGPPPPHHYMGPMMGHAPMGYSPMGMPPMTPGYVHGNTQMMLPSGARRAEVTRSAPNEDSKPKGRIPVTNTPRTPAIRLGFDAHSSKKKRKLSPGAKEPTFPFFGNRPEQPKTTALAIFSYLSNDELFNAGLVSKQWSKLAMDDELWQF